MRSAATERSARLAGAVRIAAVAAAAVLAGTDAALATTDTTFGDPLDTVLRFNAMQLMGAVGVGIAAGVGTGIVTGLVGTAIV